jgi:hypothetical protein
VLYFLDCCKIIKLLRKFGVGSMKFLLKIVTVFLVALSLHSCFGPFNPDNPGMGIEPEDSTKTSSLDNVAYWKCDDSSSRTLTNSALYAGNKGEIQSDVEFDTGVGGKGISLLFKKDTYVHVFNDSSLNFKHGDFAISLWCKPAKQVNETRAVLLSKGPVDSANSYTIAIVQKKPAVIIGRQQKQIEDTLTPDMWNHIVFTRESGVLSLYLNAKKQQIGAEPPNLDNNSGLRLGATVDDKENFRGNLDEIKIDRIAWSESQVSTEYARFRK